ncbi:MAG: SRPBCC family protein, partial [Planctomycetota bacterium]
VVSCEPRRSYAVVCDSCHSRWTSTFTFEMQGGGLTRVEQAMRIEPRSLAARLMAPLGRFFMGRLRTHMARDMQELAQRCAAPVAATAAP